MLKRLATYLLIVCMMVGSGLLLQGCILDEVLKEIIRPLEDAQFDKIAAEEGVTLV